MVDVKQTAWRVTLAVMLAACSHQGRCAKIDVKVVGAPDHTANISPDAVKRAAAATYRVRGSNHDHAFSLTADEMRALGLGEAITVRTSSANAHVHDTIVRCKD